MSRTEEFKSHSTRNHERVNKENKEINKYAIEIALKRLLKDAKTPSTYLSFKTGLSSRACLRILSEGSDKISTTTIIAESLGLSLLELIGFGYTGDIEVSPLKIEAAYKRRPHNKNKTSNPVNVSEHVQRNRKEYQKKYYQKISKEKKAKKYQENKEELNRKSKKRYQENKEELRPEALIRYHRNKQKQRDLELQKIWREKNKGYDKKYREEKKEQRQDYQRKYYEEKKEERKDYQRKYYKEQKEERKDYQRKYYKEQKEERKTSI